MYACIHACMYVCGIYVYVDVTYIRLSSAAPLGNPADPEPKPLNLHLNLLGGPSTQ